MVIGLLESSLWTAQRDGAVLLTNEYGPQILEHAKGSQDSTIRICISHLNKGQ